MKNALNQPIVCGEGERFGDVLGSTSLSDDPSGFELKMARYITQYCAFWQNPQSWLQHIIERYGKESGSMPPPQLSVGSWIAAGYCVNAMYRLSTSKEVRFFPKFYLSSSVIG